MYCAFLQESLLCPARAMWQYGSSIVAAVVTLDAFSSFPVLRVVAEAWQCSF